MKLVSIIIPIYNVEKYLEECLKSAVNQTYSNIEIIAVNDGSPDRSTDIIERFAATDPRVKHIKQVNQGLPKARVNGIAASTGDYILHLDGDDFIAENCVELMMAEALNNDADMVYCDAYSWTSKDNSPQLIINPLNLEINNGTEYLLSRIHTFIWGKLCRREMVLDLIPQRVNVNEDLFFNLQILPRCRKVAYLNQSLYYYRVNPASIMNSCRSRIAVQFLDHAIQRRDLDLAEPLKELILYDNIFIILRYLKFTEIDEQIKTFINTTYSEYKFPFPKGFKEFKMDVFLLLSKFWIKLAHYLVHR